jgi:F-type H+-transporting ATPase subunit b
MFTLWSNLARVAMFASILCVGAASPIAAFAQEDTKAVEEEHPADEKHAEEHAAGEEHAHVAEKSPSLLSFQPDLAIFSLIVFLLLLGVLSYFAWPQIAAALDERDRKITDNIAAAEARLEEAKKILVAHEAKLAAAAGEVRALLEEASRDADHTRRSIEEKGRQAAKEELDRAIREIKRARDGAIEELAGASANVAIDLARKVIRDKLTADEQSKIVKDALGKLSAATPSKN